MHILWSNEKRLISELIPAKYNPRKLTDDKNKQLELSINRFSLCDPIVINRNNRVIGGHQRLKILKQKNVFEVDVRVPSRELTLDEEKELNLRLNKNLGEWDFDLLKGFGEDLLADVGFDSAEMDKIFYAEPEEKDDQVPEIKETISIARGDTFQLGRHRLMCGDSTSATDVALLMDGKKADMVFTDPPYGVSYAAKNDFLNQFDKGKRNQREIENDQKDEKDIQIFWKKSFECIRDILAPINSYYITGPQIQGMMMMMMMMMSGLPVRHVLNWIKNSPTFSMGRLDYEYQHEPILYSWKKTHKHYGQGRFNTSTWFFDKPRASKEHPTMKPVELVENALLNSSLEGQIAYEPFSGSGTCIIACENLKRKCRAVELSPAYVAVTLQRYLDATGVRGELMA